MDWLERFVLESNHIEGINGIRPGELDAHIQFLDSEAEIEDLTSFVKVCQPDAVLRDRANLNVRVAGHIAPRGGPKIVADLQSLLNDAKTGEPYDIHCRYETLHPFTDGNGRSGRVLWLRMMRLGEDRERIRSELLGFLHCFYYQALDASDYR